VSREPGPRAPDGSPVELYQRLPPMGEAELIHAAVAGQGALLELGCGVGRITRGLVAAGHRVVAVDESPEMLADVHGAETVLADIRTLDLGRRFEGVVLASHLVNVADDATRAAFLATCARHVAADGEMLIQRLPPDWVPREGVTREREGLRISLHDVRRRGRVVSATVRYETEGRTWTHAFTNRVLGDEDLARALASAGLGATRHLDPEGTWVAAALASEHG
jgi:SAM-dependent methyltransferase